MHYVLGLKLEYVATELDKTSRLITKETHYMVSKTKCVYERFPVIVGLIFTK